MPSKKRSRRTTTSPKAAPNLKLAFDHKFFPHIIDAIADADPRARSKLRATCKDLRQRLVWPFSHIRVTMPDTSPSDPIVFGISTTRGANRDLGRRTVDSWKDATPKDTTSAPSDVIPWRMVLGETDVVDLDCPDSPDLHLWYLDEVSQRRLHVAFDMIQFLKPRILRHSCSTFFTPPREPIHVVVIDLSRLGPLVFITPASCPSKFVLAVRSGSLTTTPKFSMRSNCTSNHHIPHMVIHFTYVQPPKDLLPAQSVALHRCVRVKDIIRAMARNSDGVQYVELVGFETAPSRKIYCRTGLGPGETLAVVFREMLPPGSLPPTIKVLTNDEYAAKYRISAEDMALEKGENFLGN